MTAEFQEFHEDCPCGENLCYQPKEEDKTIIHDGQELFCLDLDCSIKSYASADAAGCWAQSYDEEVKL